jgi:type III secretion protein U
MAADTGEDKRLPPTLRRLRTLRRQGQVPRSRELVSSLSLIAVLGYVVLAAPYLFERLTALLRLDLVTGVVSFPERASSIWPESVFVLAGALVPLLALLAFTVLASSILDAKGVPLSAEALSFDLKRIGPMQGLRNIFGLRGLLDAARVLVKAVILTGCVAVLARYRINDMLWAPTCGPTCVGAIALDVLGWVLVIGVAATLLSACADFPLSRILFRRDNRMSKSEVKREEREDGGSPEIKKRRKEIRNEAASQGASEGKAASTMQPNLIVAGDGNAVAIVYRHGEMQVPVILAKAAGEKAVALVEQARSAGIAVAENPQLTRMLVRGGRVGGTIPATTFKGVAALLYSHGLV